LEKLESIRKKKKLEIDTELGKIDKQIQKCKSELDKIIATVDEINTTEPKTGAVWNEFKKWKQIRTDKYNEISSLEEKNSRTNKRKRIFVATK